MVAHGQLSEGPSWRQGEIGLLKMHIGPGYHSCLVRGVESNLRSGFMNKGSICHETRGPSERKPRSYHSVGVLFLIQFPFHWGWQGV